MKQLATRDQSQSAQFHMVRHRRITGSTRGKILMQYEPTTALLSSMLCPKPFTTPSPPIKWGLNHEVQANRAYLEYAKRHGKHQLTIRKCGFVIHTLGFLGASPDAHIYCKLPEGIAKLRCPDVTLGSKVCIMTNLCEEDIHGASLDGRSKGHVHYLNHYYVYCKRCDGSILCCFRLL